jgi:DNA-binding NarL/FixJ family response regulator
MAVAESRNMTMTELETLPEIRGWQLISPSSKAAPLSPRERQILDLITAGRTPKEVAFDLGLSDATVRVLYSRGMKKLGRRRSRRPRESRV